MNVIRYVYIAFCNHIYVKDIYNLRRKYLKIVSDVVVESNGVHG